MRYCQTLVYWVGSREEGTKCQLTGRKHFRDLSTALATVGIIGLKTAKKSRPFPGINSSRVILEELQAQRFSFKPYWASSHFI